MKNPFSTAVMLIGLLILLWWTGGCARQQTSQTVVQPEVTAPVAENATTPMIDTDALARQTAERQARMARRQFEFENVYFDYRSAVLRPAAIDLLDTKAAWLADHPDIAVRIEGHCDERGSNENNMGLGEKRAGTVKSYLMDKGIAAARLQTISFGEERPVDMGHNEEAWAKNRRAQFVILGGL